MSILVPLVLILVAAAIEVLGDSFKSSTPMLLPKYKQHHLLALRRIHRQYPYSRARIIASDISTSDSELSCAMSILVPLVLILVAAAIEVLGDSFKSLTLMLLPKYKQHHLLALRRIHRQYPYSRARIIITKNNCRILVQ